jgi:hypothetical protein
MLSLLPFALLSSLLLGLTHAFPTNTPIYLADIFHPPTMYVLAFLPGEEPCEASVLIDEDAPFSLGGTDFITLKGYWDDAVLVKDGRVFANCAVGPDSVVVGACPAGGRERLTGVVRRTWSCWVVGDGRGGRGGEVPRGEEGGSGTRAGPNRPYWEL